MSWRRSLKILHVSCVAAVAILVRGAGIGRHLTSYLLNLCKKLVPPPLFMPLFLTLCSAFRDEIIENFFHAPFSNSMQLLQRSAWMKSLRTLRTFLMESKFSPSNKIHLNFSPILPYTRFYSLLHPSLLPPIFTLSSLFLSPSLPQHQS